MTRFELYSLLIAFFALIMSILSFVLTLRYLPPSPEPILQIMQREASAVVLPHPDVDLAVGLYDEDAVIKSVNPLVIWKGKVEIRKRYEQLPKFVSLAHTAPTVTFSHDGKHARVQAGTTGVIKELSGASRLISSVKGEQWTFRKTGGVWKIVDFTYGAE
jgi:hypothetical protein